MIKYNHIIAAWFLVLISAVAWVSCADEQELPEQDPVSQYPIAFSSVDAEQEEMTRATTLGHDFVVYGYKNVGGSEQTVFNGYKVKYLAGSANTSVDNTHGYYYVYDNQSVKYWDFAASEYHFWGLWMADEDLASFSGEKNNTLTIEEVALRTGDPAPDDNVLYSSLYVRQPVSSNVVQLSFKRPYAKLRIQFYTTEPIDEDDKIELTDITFAPDPSATSPLVNKVYGKGDVKVTYTLSTDGCNGTGKETVSIDNLTLPQDALLFDAVSLTSTLGISSNTAVTAPIDDSEGFRLDDMPGSSLKAPATRAGEERGRKYYYYPLPMGELNPAFIMKVCVNGDSDMKSAVVPAAYMQWKPNYSYTYIFKITEAGKKMSFYDVMVEPWHYGGSKEDTWTNW